MVSEGYVAGILPCLYFFRIYTTFSPWHFLQLSLFIVSYLPAA